jgi:hypothetical protein
LHEPLRSEFIIVAVHRFRYPVGARN